MKQFTFSAVRGMTLNNLRPNKNVCILLKNFINDENGIYIRSGCEKIYESNCKGVVISYHYGNEFLYLKAEEGKVVVLPSKIVKEREVLNNFTKGEVIDTLETNNRVIVFFNNNKPFEIYKKDNEDYIGEEVSFSGVGKDITYSGGSVYKNRIFYYKKGNAKVYYTQPLAYKGELKEYNIEGIFGVKGKLHHLFTMGFNAGAHVTSYLLAIFDSGDILVFNGINPEDPNNWEVVLKTSLNTKVYKKAVKIGTTAYILTGRGIVDLSQVIRTNSININDTIISNDLINAYDGEIKDSFWEAYNLKEFGNFLFIYSTRVWTHYLYNFRTGGFSSIEGWNIESIAGINNTILFSNSNGVYQGFKSNSDNGKHIEAEYITQFNNFGNFLEKRTIQVLFTIKHTGIFQVYFDIHKNNIINQALNTPVTLMRNRNIYSWCTIRKSWSELKEKLWNGGASSDFYTVRVTRNKLGNSFAVKLKVINLDTDIKSYNRAAVFAINNITINYEIWGG